MKVVHISYSDQGGAGIAACRLNKALNMCGVDSVMLCIEKTTSDSTVHQYRISSIARRIEHLHIPVRQNKYRKIQRKYASSYEVMTFPEAIYDISTHHLIQDADIINLHWEGNMLNYPLFFKNVRKPVVWTLHDMNPFLGCAHYMGDVERNSECLAIENRIREIKRKAIAQHDNINVVALSDWMATYSKKSEILGTRPHYLIPNSVDTSVFRYYDKNSIRELLHIPVDKPVLLFCSQNISNYRKGFDLLLDAIKIIGDKCILMAIGTNNSNKQSDNIKFIGNIHDEQLLALMYASADAFIIPSREDNLPNVMLESLCCGTPVISMSNGGMRDCICNMKNGLLVPELSPESLAETVTGFLENINHFDRKSISDDATKKYSPERQAAGYISLYTQLA